jgi:hypothetical protein
VAQSRIIAHGINETRTSNSGFIDRLLLSLVKRRPFKRRPFKRHSVNAASVSAA